MKRDQLPLVTLDGRHAGELLAHPCACGRLMCTLGDHIWHATRDMRANGVKAQSYEPSASGTTLDAETVALLEDATERAHLEYRALLTDWWRLSRDLIRFIDRHRPDRWVELPPPATDEDWCRNHLTAGYCEPRYRGDLCRWCYGIDAEFHQLPDVQFMRERHTHGRQHPRDLAAWRLRMPTKPNKRKRKKAS